LTLFRVQSDTDKLLQEQAAKRIFESMGLELPKDRKTSAQSFDIPLIPKKEDFYMFPFRHISATIVGGGSWKATDFSEGTVLKKSTSLLRDKPAYLNHIQMVGKEIGNVGETEWVPGYKNSNGDEVPGGIEAPFVIDGILNPELVRRMSSPVSPITSASVTVLFDWEASHEFEFNGDFYWHLGEIIDDEMVRRIATKIIGYEESSLVWAGADPYAKMLSPNGELINIDHASMYAKNKFSDDPENRIYEPNRKYFVCDCFDDQKLLHLQNSALHFDKEQNDNLKMNKDLLELLASIFGTTAADIGTGKFSKADAEKVIASKEAFTQMKTNAENFQKVTAEKEAADAKVVSLEAEIATIKAAKTTLEAEKTASAALAKVGTEVLEASKKEAKRLYGVFAGDKVDPTIEAEIDAATSLEAVNAKLKLFGGKAVTEFGGHCAKCGSTDISFRSSKQTDDPNTPPKSKTVLGNKHLAESLR